MTLRGPDENSPLRSIFSGITTRDIVVAVLAIAGAYCTMQVKTSTLAEQQSEQSRQIELLNRTMAQKLDKEVYQAEQQQLHLQLNDIAETVHGINQFLLDHPRGAE